jgi:hypothetical protein
MVGGLVVRYLLWKASSWKFVPFLRMSAKSYGHGGPKEIQMGDVGEL